MPALVPDRDRDPVVGLGPARPRPRTGPAAPPGRGPDPRVGPGLSRSQDSDPGPVGPAAPARRTDYLGSRVRCGQIRAGRSLVAAEPDGFPPLRLVALSAPRSPGARPGTRVARQGPPSGGPVRSTKNPEIPKFEHTPEA